jgi:alpha-D-ribose 1-methylphosphonate 5-triphosphate synthase subunit PhnH
MTASFQGGFADPPIDAATCFRAILSALSLPGVPVPLAAGARPPAPLSAATATVLLTLTDNETPVYGAADLMTGPVREWLRFHTGAPLTSDPEAASFAVATAASDLSFVAKLPVGTADYPDRSATLILQVLEFSPGHGLLLSGPGIPKPLPFGASSLPKLVMDAISHNRVLYPLGLDVIIVTPSAVIGLPRSTRITATEHS